MPNNNPHRIGLALSGGTLKAAAHIGVLEALQDLNIQPDFIAGTSAGSFISALYAHGYTITQLKELVNRFPGPRLLDYGFPVLSSVSNLLRYRLQSIFHKHDVAPLVNGLLRGKQLEAYFRSKFRNRSAQMPFAVVATDLYTGKPIVFSNDLALLEREQAVKMTDLTRSLCGSCALPGVLTPVHLGPWLLADGALRHYVPVEVLRQAGCDKIIVVNLTKLEPNWQPTTFIEVVTRSFDILLNETISDDLEGTDVFLLEPDVSHVTWVSFDELHACVQAGQQVVELNKFTLLRFLRETPTDSGPIIKLRPLKERP